MSAIQLLYVENLISRKNNQVQQNLNFFMLVENLNFDKQIDVVWAGEEGKWQDLSAKYYSMQGHDKEFWHAQIKLTLTDDFSLPGNIQFGLRYRVLEQEYWDNNNGLNYSSEADSGIKLTDINQLQNIDFQVNLNDSQSIIPVTVAVDSTINAEKVILHWTVDNWKTTHLSNCEYNRNYWNNKRQSNARNPNQYEIQLWTGQIDPGDALKLQYIISCEGDNKVIWDNNVGNNYCLQPDQLKILILNLHCYQEKDQDSKFTQIAKAIDELDADIVCFQEVAEFWNNGEGDWPSNSARIINERLPQVFNIYTDWAHLGFDKYREGVAILSRFPISNQQSKYVSNSQDIYSIHSRKVIMTRIHVPFLGVINVFSAHLSWIEDGFEEQFQRLHEWAIENQADDVKTTLLCGDFNITAGSKGYELVVNSNEYDDQYLEVNQKGVFEKIFRVNDGHWQYLLSEDYRIDYVFMNKNSGLQVTSAKIVFTDDDYGQVSDHCGYFMTFEPKENK
ncbi:MAG: endonuclease/exonuclease/phosphatase family protein [Methylococcales bacterium]|nr:endonuclease/exonuclease/phosphatase family protein [Methylococcales bacterium]